MQAGIYTGIEGWSAANHLCAVFSSFAGQQQTSQLWVYVWAGKAKFSKTEQV